MKSIQFISLLILSILTVGKINAQTPKVIAGPMNGYAEYSEVLIWIQTSCTKHLSIKYRKLNETVWNQKDVELNGSCEPQNNKIVLTNLAFGSTYEYQIFLNKKTPFKTNYSFTFKTKTLWEWRTPAPDFKFMFGSCLYVNDSAYDRPGKPYGQGTSILTSMANTPVDLMIWLGDNTYMREADYTSKSGIDYRYQHTRSEKNLQAFLAKTQHYATWDDHDYGDNDGNESYDLKEHTRKTFIDYWGNKTFGENNTGVYSNFKYNDAAFFLLDDRSFRTESDIDETKANKTQLGATQLNWLKNNLKHSRAPFKFVCAGGQVLNRYTDKESFNLYQKERKELLEYIVDQKISGVVFLSGDRHHTEILTDSTYINELGYPFIDITSSPLSAGVSNVLEIEEAKNPQRIQGTLVVDNNYCTITVFGNKKGQRQLEINCFDKNGKVIWTHQIHEKNLKAKYK
jgi:alkaline phosphatase D